MLSSEPLNLGSIPLNAAQGSRSSVAPMGRGRGIIAPDSHAGASLSFPDRHMRRIMRGLEVWPYPINSWMSRVFYLPSIEQ